MDIMMPDMDGYQATALIRRAEARSGLRTPIIGLSARAMDDDRQRALDAGLDDYLTKPLREDLLRIALDRWVQDREVVAEVSPLHPHRRRALHT